MRRRQRRPRVTWTRADRALLAIVALRECADVDEYDPGRRLGLIADLERAADAARKIRDQCPAPPSQHH